MSRENLLKKLQIDSSVISLLNGNDLKYLILYKIDQRKATLSTTSRTTEWRIRKRLQKLKLIPEERKKYERKK